MLLQCVNKINASLDMSASLNYVSKVSTHIVTYLPKLLEFILSNQKLLAKLDSKWIT